MSLWGTFWHEMGSKLAFPSLFCRAYVCGGMLAMLALPGCVIGPPPSGVANGIGSELCQQIVGPPSCADADCCDVCATPLFASAECGWPNLLPLSGPISSLAKSPPPVDPGMGQFIPAPTRPVFHPEPRPY